MMEEMTQRGSIPEELLRPRREEAPRYPIDTVIGPLGQGQAPTEAYELARKTAAAFLAGTIDAPVLSPADTVFLEGCMTRLRDINPRSFRLGSGREEPDGSVSFLVRFVGREQGITGELYIRYEEQRPPSPAGETELASPDIPAEDIVKETPAPPELQSADIMSESDSAVQEAETAQTPPLNPPIAKTWIFEDLILENARSREAENEESRHRFDFPPYERFF